MKNKYVCEVCGKEYKVRRHYDAHIQKHVDQYAEDAATPAVKLQSIATPAGVDGPPEGDKEVMSGASPASPGAGASEVFQSMGNSGSYAPEAPDIPDEGEAVAQLKLLREALGVDELEQSVKRLSAQLSQVNREIVEGAIPGQGGGIDLTKYGVTPETIQTGLKMVMDAIFDGNKSVDPDEQLVRIIVNENKARKAANMAEKVKLVMDAIDKGDSLYVGEPK